MKSTTFLSLITLLFIFQSCNTSEPIEKEELVGNFKLIDAEMLDGTEEDKLLFKNHMGFVVNSITIAISESALVGSAMNMPQFTFSSKYTLENNKMILHNWKIASADTAVEKTIALEKEGGKIKIEGEMPITINEEEVIRTFSAYLVKR